MFTYLTTKRMIALSTIGLTLALVLGMFNTQTTAAQVATDCPTADFMDVSSYVQTQNYAQPEISVSCDGTTAHVISNGIPNFTFAATTPNDLQEQSFHWEFPQNPVYTADTTQIPLLGAIGVTVNGVPLFGPNEAPTHGYGDPYLDEILDYCNGHTGPGGLYHFHARPDCLWDTVEDQVGLVIGYSFDGFPILAPYIYADGGIVEVQSSWARTADVTNAWDAHEYIPGLSMLDECNGMTLADGSYAYFATDTFPYFLGCYHGEASTSTGQDEAPTQAGTQAQTVQPQQQGNEQRPLAGGPLSNGLGGFLSGLFGGGGRP